ncbi:MAG: M28 family metallopeptidase [Anaerolineaceae bacterium]|nr:M28 family metallopeptidase [Anaerolineaceae bacterium]
MILFVLPFNLAASPQPVLPEMPSCSANTQVSHILDRTSLPLWASWIAELSGTRPAIVGFSSFSIQTRNSFPTFMNVPTAEGFDFVLAQVLTWVNPSQVEIEPFVNRDHGLSHTWKNLIVTLPGTLYPDQSVLMTAHLDSRSESSWVRAPGADDNASGVAALLEALRVMHTQHFDRTVRFIFFSGEEQGLYGSQAYVASYSTSGILGVINMDMYGYDGDNDQCFELHVGRLAASDQIGKCIDTALQTYQPNLKRDYLTGNALRDSDHAPFRDKQVGAVMVTENFSYQTQLGGCRGQDRNPYYHSTADTLAHMNLPYGFEIFRVSLASLASMAGPEGQ